MRISYMSFLMWGFTLFMSGIYRIYLFVVLNHGSILSKYLTNFLNIYENYILLMHSYPLLFIFLNLSFIC